VGEDDSIGLEVQQFIIPSENEYVSIRQESIGEGECKEVGDEGECLIEDDATDFIEIFESPYKSVSNSQEFVLQNPQLLENDQILSNDITLSSNESYDPIIVQNDEEKSSEIECIMNSPEILFEPKEFRSKRKQNDRDDEESPRFKKSRFQFLPTEDISLCESDDTDFIDIGFSDEGIVL